MNIATKIKSIKPIIILLFVVSFFLTLFITYVDEGAYNLSWMINDPRDWIAFFIFQAFIFGIFYLLWRLFSRASNTLQKLIL
jgi:hypothetical protein